MDIGKENAPSTQGVQGAMRQVIDFQCKDNTNSSNYQVIGRKTAREFSIEYLIGTVGISLSNIYEHHTRIEPSSEAWICELFERYITGCEGDRVPLYFRSDGRSAVRVYNGRYFERIEQEEFGIYLKRVLSEVRVGRVYIQNSPKKIADEVLKELHYSPDRQWQPNSRYLVFSNGVLDIETMQLLLR